LPLARLRRLRIRGPAPPRRRCGHPRHLLRTNGCGPDQRAGSSGSIWNSRYRAAISAAQRQSRCRRGESAENPQGNSTRTAAQAQAWFLLWG